MNDMVVKSVDLMGDVVIAAQDAKGNIWAGVSYFCKALGMSKGQKDRQITNIGKDKTLSKGCCKFAAGVFDPANETLALRLDFIPLWLAKINITDKMEQDSPDLANKLLNYQLKAKDILAEAFIPKQEIPRTIPGQIQLLAQGNVELNQRVDTLEERFNKFEDELPVTGADMDDIQSALKRKGVLVMGGKKSNAYHDKSTRTFVYSDLQRELRRQFDVKKYKEIKHNNTTDALRIIEEYKLPLALKNRVDMVNAQQSLDLGFRKDNAV